MDDFSNGIGKKAIIKKTLVHDIIKTSILVVIGKSVGFIIPFVIAALFGATWEMDAFFFTYGIIFFISFLFSSTMSIVIVPYIAEGLALKEDTGRFAGSLIIFCTFGFVFLCTVFLVANKPLFSLVTRFDQPSVDFIFQLFLEMLPLVLFNIYSGIYDGILNAYKKFTIPSVTPAFRAMVVIMFMFFFKKILNIHSIIVGYIAGEIVRLIILILTVKFHKLFRIKFSLVPSKRLFEFLKKALFHVIGIIVGGLNPVIDKTMSSWLKRGSVSVLYYGERLYLIPLTICMTGLVISILSHWSEQYYTDAGQRFERNVTRTVIMAGIIILPVALLFMVLHHLIASIIFQPFHFSDIEICDIGKVFFFYMTGMVPYILSQIYARAHIVMKNTKVIMICAFIFNGLNILCNSILMNLCGVQGIALATSIVNTIGFLLLMITFRMKVAQCDRVISRKK